MKDKNKLMLTKHKEKKMIRLKRRRNIKNSKPKRGNGYRAIRLENEKTY